MARAARHAGSKHVEAYRGLGFPGADELGNMFQFNSERIPLD